MTLSSQGNILPHEIVINAQKNYFQREINGSLTENTTFNRPEWRILRIYKLWCTWTHLFFLQMVWALLASPSEWISAFKPQAVVLSWERVECWLQIGNSRVGEEWSRTVHTDCWAELLWIFVLLHNPRQFELQGTNWQTISFWIFCFRAEFMAPSATGSRSGF